jgi:hypothetical protein
MAFFISKNNTKFDVLVDRACYARFPIPRKLAWLSMTISTRLARVYFNGVTWPAGAQNEAAFHTWFGTRNDLSDWFVAWPTAFRLETLRMQPY